MSQRTKVVGARTPVIWLLIAISLIVIAALAVGGLVIYPQMQKQQAEQARGAEAEQHYQAGLAFQNVSDWTAAEGEYKQVIILDASHKDTQSRLAEVKAHLAGSTATATAVAIAQAGQAQAQLQATAIAAQATTAAGPTATAAVLEVHYQKGLGYMNMSQWAEAKTELDLVFAADPNYKEVQAKLIEVRNKLSELALLTPTVTPTKTPIPPTPTPVPPPSNIALRKPVTVQVKNNERQEGDIHNVNDGDRDTTSRWANNDYDEEMPVEVTIDLLGTFDISRIRYIVGSAMRDTTWTADLMETPFGVIPPIPGNSAWTVQTGHLTASKVILVFKKTRTAWERDWLVIGEIEIYGVPAQ
jgi:Tfp pilus assembly protein PilF